MIVVMPLWCAILGGALALLGLFLGGVALYTLLNDKGGNKE